jgi:hypothetical protein
VICVGPSPMMLVRIEVEPVIERFGVSDICDSCRADMVVAKMKKVNGFISFLLIIPLETKTRLLTRSGD